MSQSLAVLMIHGMGSQSDTFGDGLTEALSERLGAKKSQVAFGSVHWADVLKDRQEAFLKEARRVGDLDFVRLRRFVIHSLGDAVAYQRAPGQSGSTYEKIHARVTAALNDLEARVGPDGDLVILAHSLGGHIMSNYIWDRQRAVKVGLASSPFGGLETLKLLATFGCNIPMFLFALPPEEIAPITLSSDAQWLNFYDPDDVLGYPLRAINQRYHDTVTKDIAINVGGVLSSWNPASHREYWTDDDFTEPVADAILGLLS